MTESKALDAPWIAHNGKALPPEIKDDQQVDVKTENGNVYCGRVDQFFWEWPPVGKAAYSIVEYRLLG